MMRVSPEFGKLINELFGEDSFGTAQIRTEVSKAYLVELSKGKVPTAEAIGRLLSGYSDRVTGDFARRMYQVAGYAIPEEWREQAATPSAAVELALRGRKDMSDRAKQEVVDFAKEWEERQKAKKGELEE
jgi:hypothetical protein